jgi:chitodextrinase
MDAAGNYSGFSTPVQVATPSAADVEPPSGTSDLAVTAVAPTQIGLGWSPATDNAAVAGYRIERCRNEGCSSFVQVGTSTGLSFTDGSLILGATYRYRVRAVDSAQNLGAYSNIVSATATGSGSDTLLPSAATTLEATGYSNRRIDLTWTAATDNVGVHGYLIERCTGPTCTDFVQIANIHSVTNYHDTGLTAGTAYRYRLRAFDAEGNIGAFSSIAGATTTTAAGTAGAVTYQYDCFGRLKQVTVVPN